jgi:hypothetical protein
MRRGPQGRPKPSKDPEVKKLRKKQFDTYMAELDTQFDKAKRVQKTYEGASPKIKTKLEKQFKGVFNPQEMLSSSRRDATKTFMAKGGRAGFKSGSKGCKLTTKGRGRAYGKNS